MIADLEDICDLLTAHSLTEWSDDCFIRVMKL
jgi:hypothetical protein